MKWFSYLICGILIIAGIICSINLAKFWSIKSATYGEITSIETINKYDDVAKFDCTSIPLETDDYLNYTSSSSFKPVSYDGTQKNYAFLFNDMLVSNTEFFAGKINSLLKINFYDTDGEIATTISLNIFINFYEDKTEIKISTKNVNNSVAYFERYVMTNGAVFKVVERSFNE